MKEANSLDREATSCSSKPQSSQAQTQGASNSEKQTCTQQVRRDAYSSWGGSQVDGRAKTKLNPVEHNAQGQCHANEAYVPAQYHAYEQAHAETSANSACADQPQPEHLLFDLNSTPEKENDVLETADHSHSLADHIFDLDLSLNLRNSGSQGQPNATVHKPAMDLQEEGRGISTGTNTIPVPALSVVPTHIQGQQPQSKGQPVETPRRTSKPVGKGARSKPSSETSRAKGQLTSGERTNKHRG